MTDLNLRTCSVCHVQADEDLLRVVGGAFVHREPEDCEIGEGASESGRAPGTEPARTRREGIGRE